MWLTMLNVNKYRGMNGKIWLPRHITKNMSNYVRLFGMKSNYNQNTSLFNIYVQPELVITYYTTKNFANVYRNGCVICKIGSWLNILRYLSALRGK